MMGVWLPAYMLAQWITELHCAEPADLLRAKIVLVGSKADIRERPHDPQAEACVSTEEGCAMARRIGAVAYFDTSAIRQTGVREAFTAVMRAELRLPLLQGAIFGGDVSVTISDATVQCVEV
jgi:hypothetical protein